MNVVNLTPHAIQVVGGPSFPPSGQVARCAQVSAPVGAHEGLPLVSVQFGEVEGLPDPQEGVLFLVSALVRSAVPHRHDVASPGDLERNEAGQPVGCRNLVVNR